MTQSTYNPNRVTELATQILFHRRCYYAGEPKISDPEFDALEDELRTLAPAHPALNQVGAPPSSARPKVEHAVPMLSLAKTYDLKDLVNWMKDRKVVATLKMDGNSLSLVYRNGTLDHAKTRGDGRFGEDVTEKIRWVSDCLPLVKKSNLRDFEIRGELYCTQSNFIPLTQEMTAQGLEAPSNPRNTVAGILGRKQHFSLARYFNFVAFDILAETTPLPFKTETEKFHWLNQHGFSLPHYQAITEQHEIKDFLTKARHIMDADELGIDGVVFTYDNLASHTELGNTGHHPRYKFSFKWQGETAVTKINAIHWSTSRFGVVTPVAMIDPTYLSGASLTNVTLHNAAHVNLFNLKPQDRIEIVRSGEVIPKFLRVVEAAQGKPTLPKNCPSCGATLTFDEVRLWCPAKDSCPAQKLRSILNWIQATGIDDLSEKRLLNLMEQGLVSHMADLYELTEDDLLTLPLTKEKMAKKLIHNIQASKDLSLVQFLNGLGIAGAGGRTWEALLEHYPSLEALYTAESPEIALLHGFAEKSAEQIATGLREKKPDIERLLNAGVAPQALLKNTSKQNGRLFGQTFVITGTLSVPRSKLANAIEEAGGKVVGSVSKNTTALIIADPSSTSSKAKKARALGVDLWSEDDLHQHL